MTKNYTLSLLLVFLSIIALNAQHKRNCATQDVHLKNLEKNEKYQQGRNRIEHNYRSFLNNSRLRTQATGTRTIPVYVHVIYNSANENISDAQIQSQINVLNADFSATNTDISGVPSEFASSVADFQIQFEIVEITRKSTSVTSWGTDDDMKKSAQGGVDPITPDTHLNMWICNIGGGILGYAQFPGGSSSTDGVVMSPQYFGTSAEDDGSFYLEAPYDKGRTATHEVGHYLNLYHIWGDGNCNVDDEVSDTPTAQEANYGCPTYPTKSCSNNGGFTSDMFMNYMDYVNDECMFMFTEGQKIRAQALFQSGGARENLGYTCALGDLTGLAASNITDNGFELNWDIVSNAIDYDVSINGSVINVNTNSYNATNLQSGTEYTVYVRPNCSDGNGPYAEPIVVSTTGSNCLSTGDVTLVLILDNYGSETSWQVQKGNVTVAEGGSYSDGIGGTEIVQNFNFADGNYVFTISDSFGDGICCDYGEGSYELKDANNIVIASGGSFGAQEATEFCIEISTPNADPVINDQSFSVDENSTAGTSIGTIVASDTDNDNLNYSILSGNTYSAFELDAVTGALTVNYQDALDFEADHTPFSMVVEVTDGKGGSNSGNVTINLNDIAEANNAPFIDNQIFSVQENSAVNTIIGTIEATDSDLDNLQFNIISGNTAGLFSLTTSGQLTVNSESLDYETTDSYQLVVSVQDGNGGSSEGTITINVANVNESPQITGQSYTVDENSIAGTLVGNVIASDVDGDKLTYSIVSGNTDNAFFINDESGALTVQSIGALNFEATSEFSLTISVDDGNSLTATALITVGVNDLNDKPKVNEASFSIDENSDNGTIVGTVTATDEDGDPITFISTSADVFSINSNGELTVGDNSNLNYETKPVFVIAVTAQDDNGESSSSEMTINLNNVNDAPTVSNQNFSIDENSSVDVVIGQIEATDEDGDVLSYSIASGNINDAFKINSSSGDLSIAISEEINFEINPIYNLVLEVTDELGLTSEANIDVTINDINDQPVFGNTEYTVEEASDNGTVVGVIDVTDEDGDDMSLSIVDGNDGTFALDATTGELSVLDNTDLINELNPLYTLSIEANDGNGGVVSENIIVNVLKVTGIFENAQVGEVYIYPNPITDKLYFANMPIDSHKYRIYMINGAGQEVLNTQLLRRNFINGIDLNDLQKGNYIIILEGVESSFQFKKQITIIE